LVAGGQLEQTVETNPQNSAAAAASNCLATLQQNRSEQWTVPNQAARDRNKAGSCTAHVQAGTADESNTP